MDTLVTSIFHRAKDLYKEGKEVFIDPLLESAIKGEARLQDFLLLDDSIIEFHLRKWFSEKDPIMQDLIQRFFSRTGFRAVNTALQKTNIEELKKAISQDFDLRYYFYQDSIKKGVYESEVYIEKENGSLLPLSEHSLYIKKLTEMCILETYAIGPKEILKRK